MTDLKFIIAPEYRFKSMFSKLLFSIGLVFMLFSVFTHDGGIGIFIGIIFVFVGLLYLVFTSKQYLTIDNENIIFEKRCLVKVFDDELTTIKLRDIKDVYYFKRLIKLGRSFGNPYADWEDRRIISPERIVIKFKENKSKTILKLGDKEKFHQAFELIKKSIKR